MEDENPFVDPLMLVSTCLYDNERFMVVHSRGVNEPEGGGGFEFVDKVNCTTSYYRGEFAEHFILQVKTWQVYVPPAEEVDRVIEGYLQLAALPMAFH